MNKLSWQYVAGFFDGEGCITMPLSRYGESNKFGGIQPYIQMAQAGEIGRVITHEIRDWLSLQNIKADVQYRRSKKKGHKDSWTLRIRGRKWSCAFLTKIMPFVIVKRTVCQDFWRFMELYPSLLGWTNRYATHCPHGHPFDDENTFRTNGGKSRGCKICRTKKSRDFYERHRKRPRAA